GAEARPQVKRRRRRYALWILVRLSSTRARARPIQMRLLLSAIRTSRTGHPPVRRGLPVAFAATVLVAFTLFAGRAAAGAGDYPSPLYLSGGVSSNVSTSFQLLGGAPPATPATPTVALVGGGSLTGTYNYIVVAA